MTSAIDPTKPVTGTPTTQSVRDNFSAAKTEILALQAADALLAPLAAPSFTGGITIAGGIKQSEGSNKKQGVATLVAGTVTVSNTSVTANSRIFLTSNVDGGTPGWLRVSAKTVGTSFVITSSSASDTSTVAWLILEA